MCRINPRINRRLDGRRCRKGSRRSLQPSGYSQFRRVPGIAPHFAMYALQTPDVRQHLTSNISGVGGSLMRVQHGSPVAHPHPPRPAPRAAPHRTRRSSRCSRNSTRAWPRSSGRQANLERYRASVLKAAVDGRLTEQWHRENPSDETGAELLRRILAERRKRWEEEQLANFEAKGRKPPRNWKAKYKDACGTGHQKSAGATRRMVLGHG